MKISVKLLLTLTLMVMLTSACNLPIAAISSSAPNRIAGILITPNPNATATATPFQPLDNTPTPLATAAPTATPTLAVTATPELGEGQAQPITPPEGVTNIMVLGSDLRPGGGYRTDVIMWVAINAQKGTVSVVSFPRDLYVLIPGVGQQRINTAQQYSFATTQATFAYNFGVQPDYYIMTTFDGFKQIVNSLGGITINASINLTDRCDLPAGVNGWCSIGPGSYNMDGDTALWYVRSRHSTSDFDRTRRAQEVLQGIFAKLMTLNAVNRFPELYQTYQNTVDTNLDFNTLVSLATLAPKIYADPGLIQRYAVGPAEVSSWVTEGGAQVLLPNQAAIQSILYQAIGY